MACCFAYAFVVLLSGGQKVFLLSPLANWLCFVSWSVVLHMFLLLFWAEPKRFSCSHRKLIGISWLVVLHMPLPLFERSSEGLLLKPCVIGFILFHGFVVFAYAFLVIFERTARFFALAVSGLYFASWLCCFTVYLCFCFERGEFIWLNFYFMALSVLHIPSPFVLSGAQMVFFQFLLALFL